MIIKEDHLTDRIRKCEIDKILKDKIVLFIYNLLVSFVKYWDTRFKLLSYHLNWRIKNYKRYNPDILKENQSILSNDQK